MADKPIIFVYGDSPTAHTGFGRANKEIFKRLQDKYNIYFLGINYDGCAPLPETKEFNIYACVNDPRGQDLFAGLLQRHRPDLLFTLNDYDACNFVVKPLIEARQVFNKRIPWVYLFPVDGQPFYKEYVDLMKTYVDYPITITKWGQEVIKKADPDLEVPFLYHGVDMSIYKKLDSKLVEQQKENLKLKDKFIVLMVGVNQIRKQYGIAVEAFAEFAADKPDAVLHLHCMRHTSYGWNIPRLVRKYSQLNEEQGKEPILDRVNFTTGIFGPLGVPEKDMTLLYNLADVFLTTTSGEGFGLPIVEAMACELPIVAHNVSSISELVGDAGLLTKTSYEYVFPFSDRSLDRPIPDKDEIVESLNKLYNDSKLRKELGKKSRERIVSDHRFNWDFVANEVSKTIDEALIKKNIIEVPDDNIL